MKNLFILIALSALIIIKVDAQTKKTTGTKKTATTKTTANPKITAPASKISKSQPKKSESVESKASAYDGSETNSGYKTAVGLKFVYGISLTVKHFISKPSALEGIVCYRSYSGLGSEFNLTALYEYHGKIGDLSGLNYYAGGGIYGGYFSNDDPASESISNYGPTGVIGLEYKFKAIPIALSADWQPIYQLNNNGGFVAENGGIGIKYTF